MIKSISIFSLLLIRLSVVGQCSFQDYQTLLREAYVAQKAGKYDLAINKLTSAQTCLPEKVEEVKILILEVFNEVNKQRELAVRNEREAIKQQKIAEDQRDSTEQQRKIAELEKLKAQRLARSAFNSSIIASARDTNPTFAVQAAYYNWQNHRELNNTEVDFIKTYSDTISVFYQDYWYTDPYQTIRLIANGEQMFSTKSNGVYRIWDNNSKKVLRTIKLPTTDFKLIMFSSNGKFALISTGQITYLWDIEGNDSKKLPIFIPVGGSCATISSDGNLFALSNFIGEISIFQTSPFKLLYELNGHSLEVNSLMFSSNSKMLLSGGSDGNCYLWNLDSGKIIRKFIGHSREVTCVAFSPDESQIATESDDGTTKIWNIINGESIITLYRAKELVGLMKYRGMLEFSPNGKLLATTEADGSAFIWDLNKGQVFRKLIGHKGPIFSIQFSSNSESIWTYGADGTIRTWNLEIHSYFRKYSAEDVAFSEDGNLILLGRSTTLGDSELRDFQKDSILQTFNNYGGTPVAFLKENKTVFIGKSIWDSETGKEMDFFSSSGASISFSPKRNLLVVGSKPQLLDLNTNKVIRNLHEQSFRRVKFSSDCNLLLLGDRFVAIWDMTKDTIVRVISAPSSNFICSDISPNGKYVATGSDHGHVQIWEIDSGKMINDLNPKVEIDNFALPKKIVPEDFLEYEKTIFDICFSPDGTKVIAVGTRGISTVWDIPSGLILQSLPGKQNRVRAAKFSPDGNTLFTVSDTTISFFRTIEWNLNNKIYQFTHQELREKGLLLEPEHLLGLWENGIELNEEELRLINKSQK